MLLLLPWALAWDVVSILAWIFLLALENSQLLKHRKFARRIASALAKFVGAVTLITFTVEVCFVLGFGVVGFESSWMLVAALLVVVMGGFVSDILFIALTRRMLRWAGEMTSFVKVTLAIAINLLVAVLLGWVPATLYLQSFFGLPISTSFRGHDFLTASGFVIACTNLFDVLLALFFVVCAMQLLLHRAVWPVLTRTVFRMQEIGTKGRRAILTTVGIALLGTSVFGGKFPDLLKELVKAFGG